MQSFPKKNIYSSQTSYSFSKNNIGYKDSFNNIICKYNRENPFEYETAEEVSGFTFDEF